MARPAGPNDKTSFPDNPSSALESIMTEYGSVVLRTAYFYLGDRHLAEDASQEAFIRAYRNWKDFRGDSSVKTWLMRITINICRDRLGLKSSREQPTDPVLLKLREESGSAEAEAMERLGRTEIWQVVARLPAHYHEVVYLYYYLDLTTREIADTTGTPEGTVRGRLFRARELLGDALKKEELTP